MPRKSEPAPAPAVARDNLAQLRAQDEARHAESATRAKWLSENFQFLADGRHLEDFEAFRLIAERDHGCITPIEEFLMKLIGFYGYMDKHGLGLTIEHIEEELEQLRGNYADALRDSHFIASRYPRETPSL